MLEYWKNLSTKEKVMLVVKIIVGILFLLFVTRNWQLTEVYFIFFSVSLPLTAVIFLSTFLGAGVTYFLMLKKVNAKQKEIKTLTTILAEKTAENN